MNKRVITGRVEASVGRSGGIWDSVVRGAAGLANLGGQVLRNLPEYSEPFRSVNTSLPIPPQVGGLSGRFGSPARRTMGALAPIRRLGNAGLSRSSMSSSRGAVGERSYARALPEVASPRFIATNVPRWEAEALNYDPWRQRKDLGVPKNHWQKLHRGDALGDDEMKQLFHDVDLERYGATTSAGRLKAEALQGYAEQRLAEGIVRRAPRSPKGDVLFGDVPVRPEDSLAQAWADIRHFRETDEHLSPAQVVANRDLRSISAEVRNIPERTRQLIQESSANEDFGDGLDYFHHSFNRLHGRKSGLPPQIVTNLNEFDYLVHGARGEGQDVLADINQLDINENELKKSIINNKTISSAIEKATLTKQTYRVKVGKILFRTQRVQKRGIGKVKLRFSGIVKATSNGKVVVEGYLAQGKNSEVYTFPAGTRPFPGELSTTIGRNLPVTLFRTIFKGRKQIYIKI